MLVHQDAAHLGEAERRIFESGEVHGALVNSQGEQRDAVIERLLEPVGQLVGAGGPNRGGERRDRLCWHWTPASIIRRGYSQYLIRTQTPETEAAKPRSTVAANPLG